MPEIIGDYKIEYLIGKGSYGSVYKAHNIITKDVRKIIHKKRMLLLNFLNQTKRRKKMEFIPLL